MLNVSQQTQKLRSCSPSTFYIAFSSLGPPNATPLRDHTVYVAGTMRPKGRQSGAGGQTQVSPGGTGIVWQEPSITLQDSAAADTPTRVRQFLKKGVVKFQEVSHLLHTSFAARTCSGTTLLYDPADKTAAYVKAQLAH